MKVLIASMDEPIGYFHFTLKKYNVEYLELDCEAYIEIESIKELIDLAHEIGRMITVNGEDKEYNMLYIEPEGVEIE